VRYRVVADVEKLERVEVRGERRVQIGEWFDDVTTEFDDLKQYIVNLKDLGEFFSESVILVCAIDLSGEKLYVITVSDAPVKHKDVLEVWAFKLERVE